MLGAGAVLQSAQPQVASRQAPPATGAKDPTIFQTIFLPQNSYKLFLPSFPPSFTLSPFTTLTMSEPIRNKKADFPVAP